MDSFNRLVIENTQADSVGSIFIRAGIWLILVTILAYGVAKGKSNKRIKSEAGLFIAFLILSAVAIYIAFGFVPTLTSIN